MYKMIDTLPKPFTAWTFPFPRGAPEPNVSSTSFTSIISRHDSNPWKIMFLKVGNHWCSSGKPSTGRWYFKLSTGSSATPFAVASRPPIFFQGFHERSTWFKVFQFYCEILSSHWSSEIPGIWKVSIEVPDPCQNCIIDPNIEICKQPFDWMARRCCVLPEFGCRVWNQYQVTEKIDDLTVLNERFQSKAM